MNCKAENEKQKIEEEKNEKQKIEEEENEKQKATPKWPHNLSC